MPERQDGWLTAQQAGVEMNTTRAEICPLLSLGRFSGHKRKQSGRPGKGQWLINPKSIVEERRRTTKRTYAPTKHSRKPS